MKKLKLKLDDLQVESFRPVAEESSMPGTVRANSGCCYPGVPNHTEYFSTCRQTEAATCNGCLSNANGGCIPLYTYEESYCQCTAVYSCECEYTEATNCHRCTVPGSPC